MNYVATRGFSEPRTFEQVLVEGSAPDGGLYIPEFIPPAFVSPSGGHADQVAATLEFFGARDVGHLVATAFTRFNHPEVAPIVDVGPYRVMEMFWGPTLSFKDHALQILARLMNGYLQELGETRTVLVATSGDTGSAAIEAFRGLETLDIVVLFPEGLVSEFQRRQMTTSEDDNVTVAAVAGDFDDCQRMVKEAFVISPGLASANSINWGRIAAQVGYYMSASARIGERFDVVIPTGNFGNAYSAFLSQDMGSLIQEIAVATNTNRVLYELHHSGQMSASPALPTVAPAMDIQVPSNLERYLFDHEAADFATDFEAGWASDRAILDTIRRVFEEHGYLIDPHTAAAWSVADALGPSDLPRLIVSTAHPAKFATTIEEATSVVPQVPQWAEIEPDLPDRHISIRADVEELLELIDG